MSLGILEALTKISVKFPDTPKTVCRTPVDSRIVFSSDPTSLANLLISTGVMRSTAIALTASDSRVNSYGVRSQPHPPLVMPLTKRPFLGDSP